MLRRIFLVRAAHAGAPHLVFDSKTAHLRNKTAQIILERQPPFVINSLGFSSSEGVTIMKEPSGSAANAAMLQLIQEQMRDMCHPQYDEFYKVTTERGFTKITIPKSKQQSVA
jgi:hypothetical protein